VGTDAVRAELLAADDPRWPELLGSVRHDVYQLPGYVAVEARRLGGEAVAAVARVGGGFVLAPLVLRKLPAELGLGEARDAVSPYGYPGLVSSGDPATDRGALEAALQAMLEKLGTAGVCSVFLRLHTLLPQPLAALAAAGRLVRHGETVWIDLAPPEEDLWAQTRQTHRQLIRKLERQGAVARLDTGWERLDEFVTVYHETMTSVHAQDWYYFGRDYFAALREALGGGLRLSLVELGDELLGAGLFTECGGIVQYHLGAIATRWRAQSPTRLMLHFVTRWAKARGNAVLHLGGGVGSSADSLFQFKAGFSPLRAPFHTWRAVSHPALFAAATARWEVLAGRGAEGAEGFFPPYRATL
jgi:CelD/BcsL family acetyltransferase involved in cellulose biosynthesis